MGRMIHEFYELPHYAICLKNVVFHKKGNIENQINVMWRLIYILILRHIIHKVEVSRDFVRTSA